jgi:hypothetical protein
VGGQAFVKLDHKEVQRPIAGNSQEIADARRETIHSMADIISLMHAV